jgi:hypothetical protein
MGHRQKAGRETTCRRQRICVALIFLRVPPPPAGSDDDCGAAAIAYSVHGIPRKTKNMRCTGRSIIISSAISMAAAAAYTFIFWHKLERRMPFVTWQYVAIISIIFTLVMSVVYPKTKGWVSVIAPVIISVVCGAFSYIATILLFYHSRHGIRSIGTMVLIATISPAFVLYTWVPGVFASIMFGIVYTFKNGLPPLPGRRSGGANKNARTEMDKNDHVCSNQ